ncbi:putative Regulatory protein recX [Cocos nucifera]|nr:putative Regulatory protein recX [Cocos nucifera]
MRHGMSKTSMDRLFLQASKQWLRGQSTSLENRKARIIRWLQYRGFGWGVTSTILERLESQYPLRE